MQALALIPARYDSTRFPGKPLAAETGRPLIQHVVERVRECQTIDRVVVATDDQRIFDAVVGFGGEVVMTGEHPNGTSRLAEAVEVLEKQAGVGESDPSPFPLIVNVQGDEPEVPATTVDALVRGLAADPESDMATLASPFEADEDPSNPNVVKLVLDRRGRAMYFSRSPIPHDRDAPGSQGHCARAGSQGRHAASGGQDSCAASASRGPCTSHGNRNGSTASKCEADRVNPAGQGHHAEVQADPEQASEHLPLPEGVPGAGVVMYKHPGLYAYRRAFLALYPTLAPTPLEQAEKLEQLRVLEHGYAITVIHADAPHPGIDTPEQYAAFVKRWRTSN